jgi:hypothetical protein
LFGKDPVVGLRVEPGRRVDDGVKTVGVRGHDARAGQGLRLPNPPAEQLADDPHRDDPVVHPDRRGVRGIPGIPELQIGGFNFGDEHTVAGLELGRFSNYYFLLLVLIAFVVLVFARLNESRIGVLRSATRLTRFAASIRGAVATTAWIGVLSGNSRRTAVTTTPIDKAISSTGTSRSCATTATGCCSAS